MVEKVKQPAEGDSPEEGGAEASAAEQESPVAAERGHTKYATESPVTAERANTKYAAESPVSAERASTKYATESPVAAERGHTKYATETPDAAPRGHTKYATGTGVDSPVAELRGHTKYAAPERGFRADTTAPNPQAERRVFEAAVEEVVAGFWGIIQRTVPDASADMQAELLRTMIEKFGVQSLKRQQKLLAEGSNL